MDVSYRRSLDRKITNDIGELENVQFLLFGEMKYSEERNQAERMLDNLDEKEKENYIDTCLNLIGKNSVFNNEYQLLLEEFYPYLITLHKLEDVLKGKVRILCGSMNPGLGIDYLYSFKFPDIPHPYYLSGTKIKNLYEKAMTMVYDLIQFEEEFWKKLHKELITHFMTVELPELHENSFKKLFSNDYNNDDSIIPMYIQLCKDISKISDGWSDKEKINNICSKISLKISLAEVVADGCIFIMKDYSYEMVKNRTITEKILSALKINAYDVLDTSKSFLKSAANFCKRKGGRRKKKTKKSKKKKRKSKKKKRKSKKRRRTKNCRRR